MCSCIYSSTVMKQFTLVFHTKLIIMVVPLSLLELMHRRLLSFCRGEFVAATSSHRSRRKPAIISLAVSITKQYGLRVNKW